MSFWGWVVTGVVFVVLNIAYEHVFKRRIFKRAEEKKYKFNREFWIGILATVVIFLTFTAVLLSFKIISFSSVGNMIAILVIVSLAEISSNFVGWLLQ